MMNPELGAEYHQVYLKQVVYPRVELLGPHERELELMGAVPDPRRRLRPLRWVGGKLAILATRLIGAGRHVVGRATTTESGG